MKNVLPQRHWLLWKTNNKNKMTSWTDMSYDCLRESCLWSDEWATEENRQVDYHYEHTCTINGGGGMVVNSFTQMRGYAYYWKQLPQPTCICMCMGELIFLSNSLLLIISMEKPRNKCHDKHSLRLVYKEVLIDFENLGLCPWFQIS